MKRAAETNSETDGGFILCLWAALVIKIIDTCMIRESNFAGITSFMSLSVLPCTYGLFSSVLYGLQLSHLMSFHMVHAI